MSKVVIVNYNFNDAFKIPKNIDLEDETVVEGWWVKWNTLHILFVDGTKKEIKSEGWTNDLDFKYPSDDPEIVNAKDWHLEDDEEEKEEDEEVPEPIVAPAPVVAPEPVVKVSKIQVNGKTYLKTFENVLYDMVTKFEVGTWDPETKTMKELPEDEAEYECSSD